MHSLLSSIFYYCYYYDYDYYYYDYYYYDYYYYYYYHSCCAVISTGTSCLRQNYIHMTSSIQPDLPESAQSRRSGLSLPAQQRQERRPSAGRVSLLSRQQETRVQLS
ncbi:hypothetical protein ASPZODRAFT_141941 [Penicilliopsis zonata CBS 506.65]|uniref:Uncharacterized protein n=1 Tax=Penicilliopsis zonata CBS 506.65 TaxID=1073090 RepID=A0A1L9SIZ1_9EURO|nr:hypothetical protein ASPZODRAFT_141941 [Penicilliopsis zonata CBS 506.65]OJJ47189.1 hypothetical protein ASPZODRAFT_141941 [Penicilliopsis zonata CBS 506.65]